MNVPDELRKLYEDTAQKVLAERPDVTLEEVDDRALAAVLDRHEQMVIGRRPHQPVIASRTGGTWGVYCDACSAEIQNYTRCKVRDDWPPDVLADPVKVREGIAEDAYDVAEMLKANPSLTGDAATLNWFADKIAGDSR